MSAFAQITMLTLIYCSDYHRGYQTRAECRTEKTLCFAQLMTPPKKDAVEQFIEECLKK